MAVQLKAVRLRDRFLGAGVRLAEVPEATAEAPNAPIWIQIATAGTYKGYRGGELTLDDAFFQQVIANFRRHPAYKAGPDGKGAARVVPYDYEHASEMEPTEGSIPTTGAPAPAWALELELRKGPEDVSELWALTELTEQAREQIRAGGYQWTSIAAWKNAVDPVTGEKVGAVITSIAFTNKPFIRGMAPMRCRVDVWGEAESPEELIIGLREILEVEEDAPAERLQAELRDLGVAYSEGRRLPGFPEGVGHLLDRVRRLVGVRALSTADEILAAAGQQLAALSASPAPSPPAAPASPSTEDTMSAANLTLTARLAEVYKVRDKEDAIIAAAQEGQAARGALSSLMELFGSSDTQGLLADAAKAIEEAEKAKELVTALQAAQSRLAETDKKDAEEEVEAVAASMGLSGQNKERFKKVLFRERMAIGGDAAKLDAWRKENGLVDAQGRLLTTAQLAGPNGLQLGGRSTGLGAGNGGTIGAQPSADDHPLLAYPGANRTMKAVEYLKEKKPGFTKLDFRDQVARAGQYIREGAPVL